MSFFVKNVENVQGDERDMIIFSSTFGRDEEGSFRRQFGLLSQTGGERRLNVAITRAREKIILSLLYLLMKSQMLYPNTRALKTQEIIYKLTLTMRLKSVMVL